MKKEGHLMKKRLFAVALAATMMMSAASFAGCGEKKEESSASVVSSTATPSEATKDSANLTAPSSAAVTTTAPTEATAATEKKDTSESETKSVQSSASNRETSEYRSGSANTAVTSVSLSRSSISLYEGDSATFEVMINPSDATDRQYNVVTNNGNATIDCNGSVVTVYGENRGNCEITVSSTNGKSASCSVTVNSRPTYNNGNSGGSSASNSGNNNSGNNNSGGSGNSGEINDDTLLTHAQICSDFVMGRVCDAINDYFVRNHGMVYNSSLTKNDYGWFLSGTNYYLGDYYFSINSMINRQSEGFENELYALVDTNNGSRDDIPGWAFRCYYERQSDGEYRIYFCHK